MVVGKLTGVSAAPFQRTRMTNAPWGYLVGVSRLGLVAGTVATLGGGWRIPPAHCGVWDAEAGSDP